MQPLPWTGLAGSAITALIPAHGGSTIPEGTNDFVFWALPVAKFLFNVSGATVTGALVLACLALKPGGREHARALNLAGTSAAVWMLAAAVAGFLDALDNWGQPVAFTDSFARQLGHFFLNVGLGQMWLATVVIISLIPLLCLGARSLGATAVAALLALAGWVPLALIGHPNYGQGHEAGILAFALHIIAAATWLGGLITLVALRPVLDSERLHTVAGRYSTLALVTFLVLVFSGFLRAQVTVGTLENLRSPFGSLVAVKIAVAFLVGLVGFAQRRWILSRMGQELSGRFSWFWRLVALELLLMGLASGAAVTLLRLDEPIPDNPLVNYRMLAEKMADEPLPPAPTPAALLTETLFDPLWTFLAVAGAACYLAGVRRLHRQGRNWPGRRTASWLAGMLTLLYLTNGGVNQYQNFLLSTQILLQMALTTIGALLLVLGHPVSLARAAVRPRRDGSTGVREWVGTLARSPAAHLLTHPHVAAGLVMASMLVYYHSPLLEWSARDLLGHQWMVIHFLAAGSLLDATVLGATRRSGQTRRRARTAVATLAAFYAVFGATLLLGNGLLSANWYAAMEQPWGIDPLADQRLGGWYIVVLGAAQVAGLAAVASTRRRASARDHDQTAATPAEPVISTGTENAGQDRPAAFPAGHSPRGEHEHQQHH